jgi:hypothetical protein
MLLTIPVVAAHVTPRCGGTAALRKVLVFGSTCFADVAGLIWTAS